MAISRGTINDRTKNWKALLCVETMKKIYVETQHSYWFEILYWVQSDKNFQFIRIMKQNLII